MTVFQRISSYLVSVRQTIRVIASSPLMRAIAILPPILCVITTLIIIWFLRFLPPQVPLYYSRPWGEEQLASPIFLLVLPLMSFLWYIVGLFFIHHLAYAYRVFAQILLVMQAVCSVLATLIVLNVLHLMI